MAENIRQAFVLGAGLGTRLQRLTAACPKPLVPVVNRPLITYAFDHLLGSGIERFVVNTHHCAGEYARAFPRGEYRGKVITFRHEPVLLETAGGIGKVADLLGGEPFFVYNGDVLTDLPLAPALAHHAASGNEVTLILRSHDGPRQVTLDESTGRVLDLGGRLHPAIAPGFLFTGLYLVQPEFIRRIPRGQKLSVIPLFLEMIRSGAPLGCVVIDEGRWHDLGTREQYLAVHRILHEEGAEGFCSPQASIAAEAQLLGATAVGTGAEIGSGAILRDCVLWENARIAPGAMLTNCIVTAGQRVSGTHSDAAF
jgi:NDP-sugar pyrophosphorylase family protein